MGHPENKLLAYSEPMYLKRPLVIAAKNGETQLQKCVNHQPSYNPFKTPSSYHGHSLVNLLLKLVNS